MSLGSGTPSSVLEDAVEYAASRDVSVIAAAGNRAQADSVLYPAAFDDGIAVSAMAKDETLAGFSSYGEAVFIAAPGTGILSLDSGGGTRTLQGTSMASPHVAGAAGLLRSLGKGFGRTERLFQLTAEDVVLAEEKSGAGLLDVETAVERADGVLLTTNQPEEVCDGEATLSGTVIQMGEVESAREQFESRPSQSGLRRATT